MHHLSIQTGNHHYHLCLKHLKEGNRGHEKNIIIIVTVNFIVSVIVSFIVSVIFIPIVIVVIIFIANGIVIVLVTIIIINSIINDLKTI